MTVHQRKKKSDFYIVDLESADRFPLKLKSVFPDERGDSDSLNIYNYSCLIVFEIII